jgi:hypothetical protein
MANTWVLSALWVGLAPLTTLLTMWLGISSAELGARAIYAGSSPYACKAAANLKWQEHVMLTKESGLRA